ncbi:protein ACCUMULATION AND REPLICATION OF CHLOROPLASTS 6, chloroplastic isoform X2 [Ricinus communis]|uniref:protein ACCUMULATION AND REPLICATION OF CHLOROPLASTS 6, chloroplastic isoform X2 n=1 Tax=Ricinus communis TaxID=3988 RepID=UPI00201A95AA|nr:protein ACCUMULATION AND REPLICATION OF CHLOROPLASTS 6, chloroplastic isoform X2 [Ricinus communis]
MEGMRCIGIAAPRVIFPYSPPPRRFSHSKLTPSTTCSASKWADRLSDFQFFTTATDTSDLHCLSSSTAATIVAPVAPPERHVSIPLNFYQVLGAETHFLGDGIKRAYSARLSKPPQSGFSEETLISRRQIIQAACETLANPQSRREYNQGLLDDELDTIITQVPWDKVPGALCVLEEAGETEVVLEIGETLLRERLPKNFKQDLVLVVALAYVEESRDAMALSPPDFITGSEMLERALKLLQEEGASGLAPDLQKQIDENLEEITPWRVLQLLALPLDDAYRMRRAEGLLGVRNVLWAVGKGGASPLAGGFTREDFMNEAFLRMTSAEQTKVPGQWNADSAYSPKQNYEIDYSLARGLCSLLLGDLDECRTRLGLDSDNSPYRNPLIVDFVMKNSQDDNDNDLRLLCKLLETWLMEVVLPRFRDTKDIQVKLGDYYDDPTVLGYLENLEGGGRPLLASAADIVRIGAEEATAVIDHVKASAIQALQKVFPISQKGTGLRNGGMNYPFPAIADEEHQELLDPDVKAEISGEHNAEVIEDLVTDRRTDTIVKIMCTGVTIGLVTFFGLKCLPVRNRQCNEIGPAMASDTISVGFSLDDKSVEEFPRMDARFAEGIVRKWQNIKSQAFGSDHSLGKLHEVLDGQMLKTWTDRAAEVEQLGWVYDYTLLDLTVDSVIVSLDGQHAVVEATIKESACLIDAVHPENNASNITTYTTRYEMSCSNLGWKITEGAIIK